jgi:N-acetylneuraminate lyase
MNYIIKYTILRCRMEDNMDLNLNRFKGIFVALNACFDSASRLNTDAVRRLTRFYADKGVKGLYVCGSTGEGFLMSVEERKKTLKAVIEEAGNELTVISHVGSVSTKDSIELAKHAESIGAHAVSAVPCVYYKLPESSIEKHWLNIIDSTSLPFIIYNIPQMTGYDLSYELLSRMIAHDKVIGVKNTSMSSYQTQQFKKIGRDHFIVFNGPDEQYLAGRIMGAEAGIGGTYGAMPELFLKIEQCIIEGNIIEAQKWQFIVNDIITELLSFPSLYGAVKALIKLQGIDIGEPRLPLEPVPKDQYHRIVKLHEKITECIKQSHE